MSQATIAEPDETEPPNALYAVVTAYIDDPHPHVEGVFAVELDARELLKACGRTYGGPFPDAWALFKLAPGVAEQLEP